VDEARRRGIQVEVLDADAAYFRLTMGARTVTCRESLSELTSAIAMSRCDDKHVTHRVLGEARLHVPDQIVARDKDANRAFLDHHERIVVKPRRGEQGAGITVDVRTHDALAKAVRRARGAGGDVLLEAFHPGEDLRVIVIDGEVVAAAVRRPAQVVGDGRRTVRELVRRQSRRRAAATGGESRIPTDADTWACVREAGYGPDDVLPAGETVRVRKTANLHTGGTIEDVTERLHPALAEVSVRAAAALEIPVVGLDLMVPRLDGAEYVIIEANERPGLANHEPAPTAERFVDFLFPQSRTQAGPSPRVPPGRRHAST
jgi:GNAT-family acetyltransferase (TIGR03103 family)